MTTLLDADLPALVALRRDIHAHPELGFEEVRTSDLVAERLQSWGIPVHRGIGRTGLVAITGPSASSVSVCSPKRMVKA